jgi:hypothetical protein
MLKGTQSANLPKDSNIPKAEEWAVRMSGAKTSAMYPYYLQQYKEIWSVGFEEGRVFENDNR